MARKCSAIVLIGVLVLAACGKAPQPAASESAAPLPTAMASTPAGMRGVVLTDAVIRLPLVAGNPGVAYFTLSQTAGTPRKLVSVSVLGAGRAEMHESKTVNNVSSMDAVKEVAIEPGKTLRFAPGGYHVMLFDLDKAMKPGTTRKLTATLDNGDNATAMAKVEGGAGSAMGHMDGM